MIKNIPFLSPTNYGECNKGLCIWLVPTCVKTFCDRSWSDQIATAKFACDKRVEFLKLEFSFPVWLTENSYKSF